jgi:hypothetical protein
LRWLQPLRDARAPSFASSSWASQPARSRVRSTRRTRGRASWIHGVEIAPEVVEAGRRYFALGSIPELAIDVRDARVAVESLDGRFHVIVVDVFRGLYLPAHLVTREFFEGVPAPSRAGGVLAINVATPLDSGRLLGALGATLEQVFEDVRWMQLPAGGPVASTILFASRRCWNPRPPTRSLWLCDPSASRCGRSTCRRTIDAC